MAAPLLPLENGPSTIFNQKPALIDPVALEVGRMLETHSQACPTSHAVTALLNSVPFPRRFQRFNRKVVKTAGDSGDSGGPGSGAKCSA